MKPILQFERIPSAEEPNELYLIFEATNQRIHTKFEFYLDAESVAIFGKELQSFPLQADHVINFEIGSEDPADRFAYYLKIKVYRPYGTGGAYIHVRTNNNQPIPNQEIADFCFKAEPVHINLLGRYLSRFAELNHRKLLWHNTECELIA